MAKEALRRMVNFTQDLLEVVNASAGIYSVDEPCNYVKFINGSGAAFYLIVNPGEMLSPKALDFNKGE